MSLVGLPTPEEPFVDREELAQLLHIGVRTLDRWRKLPGFPEERWGTIVRFQVGEVRRWQRSYFNQEAA